MLLKYKYITDNSSEMKLNQILIINITLYDDVKFKILYFLLCHLINQSIIFFNI